MQENLTTAQTDLQRIRDERERYKQSFRRLEKRYEQERLVYEHERQVQLGMDESWKTKFADMAQDYERLVEAVILYVFNSDSPFAER